jgi:hypothetical protein
MGIYGIMRETKLDAIAFSYFLFTMKEEIANIRNQPGIDTAKEVESWKLLNNLNYMAPYENQFIIIPKINAK